MGAGGGGSRLGNRYLRHGHPHFNGKHHAMQTFLVFALFLFFLYFAQKVMFFDGWKFCLSSLAQFGNRKTLRYELCCI